MRGWDDFISLRYTICELVTPSRSLEVCIFDVFRWLKCTYRRDSRGFTIPKFGAKVESRPWQMDPMAMEAAREADVFSKMSEVGKGRRNSQGT